MSETGRPAPPPVPDGMTPSDAAPEAPDTLSTEVSYDDALRLALTLHRQGKLDAAAEIYRALHRLDPQDPNPTHFLGVLCDQRGQSEEALALIRESIALDPTVLDWHNNLGNVLLGQGRLDDAARAYEAAARVDASRADVHNNLGVLRREQGRLADAEAAYRRAIELEPENADAYSNLGRLMAQLGRGEEALRAHCQALVLKPGHAPAREALGMAYYTLGRMDEAAQVYRDWLRDDPGNPVAQHHLAACAGATVPARAADAYVEQVFDGFADSFDAKLAVLQYRAPALVAQAVADVYGAPGGALRVLDAGCGTGLCGPLLAPYARRLDGVDLSERMLAKARPRQLYHTLTKAELTGFMEALPPASYDLIVSADTLCYFGDLRAVAHAATRALAPGGTLVFSVEAYDEAGNGDATGYRLQPHGRYSHRDDYLREVLTAAGLSVAALLHVHLRTEGGRPVDGRIVTATRRM
ncbi:tetratricopeptide repeat protein [Burkholderia guangdongensis]|uniref:tetratricopeptide repeat protein n=1 Tax=Burkholderia guangdongensis TaxID=1792500 RepID=UPI001C5371B4|nr:tetratricopeptide repeat protein [Burkholderia guangdongensis]